LAKHLGEGVTLTNRLNLFFLTALAAVLVGFSAAIYWLAQSYFERQNEQHLTAALSTLVAAAEVAPEGVAWDLTERRLNLAGDAWGNQVAWIVIDDAAQVIDHSKQLDVAQVLLSAGLRDQGSERLLWNKEPWRLKRQKIEATPKPAELAAADTTGPADEEKKHRAISIAAAIPLAPAEAALRNLGAALAGVSSVVWLAGLVAGRAVCRRALLPVANMATAARAMDGAELADRLPTILSGDEIEELGRAFNGLLDRLQESFERQRQFTGDASHQLRTPLAAILGQIEVALRRERSADEYQQTLATVQQIAGHLRQIVESLLFLARADAEARLPERQRIDLSAWLPEQIRQWPLGERSNDVIVDCRCPQGCQVDAHPALLSELVTILVDNASKYSLPGTTITLRLHSEATAHWLDVIDHGAGIAETDLPHLFTPFFRSTEARRCHTCGIGLGLSIAKRLAEAFGGDISVTSRVGDGSCFRLKLPRSSAAALCSQDKTALVASP
jgi:signal transduction histidine kinase